MEVRREQGTRRIDRNYEVSNRCAREASRVGGGQRQLNERRDGAQHSRAHSQRAAGKGGTLMGSWRDVIPVHPAADLFPMMPRDELITLGNDIKKNGLRNPVAIWIDQDDQRYLADGRNRLDAMAIVGIDVMDGADGYLHYETVEGDPYDYVISANSHRRQLNAGQRRDLITKALGPVKFSETVVKFSEMVNTMKVELDQYNQAKADGAEQAKADRAEAKAKAKAEATG